MVREVNFLEDISGPFYPHNGDSPGLILVSDLLVGSNYNNWSRCMLTALTAKNKDAFVDGSTPKPDTLDPTYNYWIRCNHIVVSWLRNSVNPEIRSSLLYLESAAQIWKDLHRRFSQGNAAARIYQLKQQLTGLKQGSMDINSYHTKFRVCWDELQDFQPTRECKCGIAKSWSDYQQQECVMQFLMGLNGSYSKLRSEVISRLDPVPPPLDISKVLALVVQEERRMKNEQSGGKMMKKKCYKFVVRNYSAYEGVGMGKWIQSRAFAVGGHKFRLELYPEGRDVVSHYSHLMSVFIRNESASAVQVVAAVEVLDPKGFGVQAGYSCFHDRRLYKHVVTIEAGKGYGEMDIESQFHGCVREDSIIIRVTLGVFVDAPVSQESERCLFFEVGDGRYYAEEAVIATRCPALLSYSHSQSQPDHIVISDVEANVFEVCMYAN